MRAVYKLRLIIIIIILVNLVATTSSGQNVQKVSENDLPDQYKEWLKLVAYFIQPVEREVFLKLSNNRERDIFIEMFWKQRDPTPGTPENEYRDEIVRRFNYVNKFFSRSSVREGWQTDMGKFYMILGPPASIEKFESSGFIVPCQAWTYYGDQEKNLPEIFVLLFFQKGGIGDYKLYDPLIDGPSSLLVNKRDLETLTNEEIYDKIRELAPTLADLSISMIPGEINFDYSPSPKSNIILAEILSSPKKEINASYATHFLNYRGIVTTDYLTNYIESTAETALILDPQTGIRFLHYSIVPSTLSFDYYAPKNQHFCNIQANVTLRTGEQMIFQNTRSFPIYIADDQVDRIRANGIAIEDSFPVSPGKYKLSILLMNSVGKEFCVTEREVEVPFDPAEPKLGGPYLGYKTESYSRDVHIPFKIGETKIVVDPKKIFSVADYLTVLFSIENLTEELRTGGEVRMNIIRMRTEKPEEHLSTIKLTNLAGGRVVTVSRTIPIRELEPDYYEIKLSLISSDGRVLDETKDNFIVSMAGALGHPIAYSKGFPLSNQYLYFYMLGQQEDSLGRKERAARFFERAFNLNPDYYDGILMYADFLIRAGEFDRALQVVDKIKVNEEKQFEYHLIRGRALMGKELYEEAIISLLEANKIYNSDIRVLNALGFSYRNTGQKTKALEVLNASLKLNPAQPEIKQLINELGKE